MVKTYRMWRFVRVVEKRMFDKESAPYVVVVTKQCNKDFCKLKTVFRRRSYTTLDGVKACFMADKFGFLDITPTHDKEVTHVGVTAKGLTFSTLSGLINELSGSIAKVPPVASLIVSLLAILLSIIALSKHT